MDENIIELTFTTSDGEGYDVSLPTNTMIGEIAEQFAETFEVDPSHVSFFYQTYLLANNKQISDYKFDPNIPIYIRLHRRKIQTNIFKNEEKRLIKPQQEPKKEESRPSPKSPPKPAPKPKPAQEKLIIPGLDELINMGFSEDVSKRALQAANGNVELATSYIIEGNIPNSAAQPPNPPPHGGGSFDAAPSIDSLQNQLTDDQKEWCRAHSGAIDYDTVVQILIMAGGDKQAAIDTLSTMR